MDIFCMHIVVDLSQKLKIEKVMIAMSARPII